MKQRMKEVYESSDSNKNPESTLVTWGLVLKLPLESIPELKSWLLKQSELTVIYQKVHAGFLRIVEG